MQDEMRHEADAVTQVGDEAPPPEVGLLPPPAAEAAAGAVDRPAESDEFTDVAFLGTSGAVPDGGWRHLVYVWTRQRINPGPSRRQLRDERLYNRVRRPVKGCQRIAVVARKGGVGKTTVSLGLGHVLASVRHDRTVAIDANPDAGTLGYRMPTVGKGTITDLVRDGDDIHRYSEARLYTAFAPSRLEVVASNDDPSVVVPVGGDDYRRAIEVLERHYNLVISDTGSDITHSVTRAVLNEADQLVVVSTPSLDGARAAAKTLDWLEHNGHARLASEAVVVINGLKARTSVDVDRVLTHFSGRVRAVETIPWDRELEAGGRADLELMQPATRRAFTHLAAATMDGFAQPATVVLD